MQTPFEEPEQHLIPLQFADPEASISQFHELLLDWWRENQRKFPWRETKNSFHLLISEMMLRRTRADQVVNVYLNFVDKYPDPNVLANADPKDVQKDLYSLGLAWRVPAFQQLAQILTTHYDDAVPDQYEELVQLPGIGDYVASAVCSFAFGQPIAIIDTNTVRVAGRLFDIPTHAESRRRKPIRDLIYALLDHKNPGAYNYALLDLAAKICTPHDPQCVKCPVKALCKTGRKRLVNSLEKGESDD
jgi:A/G-specific adenine glycosylase